MSLFSALRGLFGRNEPPSPALRNKPGGMAWIKRFGQEYGAEVIAGRAVKTVRLTEHGLWEIDPPQTYVLTAGVHCGLNNYRGRRGDSVTSFAIVDELLEPWKDTGLTTDEVTKLYSPAPVEVTR
jgi:hypothetical protein